MCGETIAGRPVVAHIKPRFSRTGIALGISTLMLTIPLFSPLNSIPAHAGEDDPCTRGTARYLDQPVEAIAQLGIREAWNISRGEDVTVAIIDSGVDKDNAHFSSGQILPGLDLVDPDGLAHTDNEGHGTAIAGQIVAQPYAGSQLIGLAPKAKILPVRTYDNTSKEAIDSGNGPSTERLASGIIWAADHNAQIIVVAQSVPDDVGSLRSAISYADSHGSLVVASAGNRNTAEDKTDSIRFPAGYPSALAVTAVDAEGLPTDSSIHGAHVEIAAPGAEVLSTFFSDGDCVFSAKEPSSSLATGYTGAVAALVAAAHPNESPAEWKYRILVTALRSTADRSNSNIGWGVLAPRDALSFINDGTAIGPENPTKTPPKAKAISSLNEPEPPEDTIGQLRQIVAFSASLGITAIIVLLLLNRLRRKAKS